MESIMPRLLRRVRRAAAVSGVPVVAAFASCALCALLATVTGSVADACTRALYVGADGQVITGRTMDWSEDMGSNLWVFPAGMARDGAAGPRSPRWTSKYGSVIVSGYEIGSVDGINEPRSRADVDQSLGPVRTR